MSVMQKLMKASKIKESAVLSESKVYAASALVDTGVPMINVALSGCLLYTSPSPRDRG